jgi:hypothetical protein
MSSAVLTADEVATMVREVTDEEVAFYLEHGWVKLEGLIAPELAAELLRVGLGIRAREEKSYRFGLRPDGEPYRAFEFSEPMCRNAERFMNRKRLNENGIGVRYGGDNFIVKAPGAGKGAAYHQDAPEHGSDRVGETRFWVAVDDITADMGPMRFIDRSHEYGPLGAVLNDDYKVDLLDLYPKLAERLTPPIEYKAGDATVHHGYMAHGSGPNTTDRPRLSFLLNYVPADMRYWGGKYVGNPGSERRPLDDERWPIVYPRTSEV